MAVMYFDLDSFKQINDRYGHAAGDAVLRTASQRMLHNIRCTDVAARVGGDEFVILLPGVSDRGDAVRSAELIGQAISEPMEIAGIDVRVGSSAGIAMYPADGRHADALLKAADAEMYRIKRSHRSESLR
jgi:diguanylate cyclase (GGDEF)-like protein